MKRVKAFKAHPEAIDFLDTLNQVVSQGESNLNIDADSDAPIFLVVGAPRSGTTVLMQWLNSIGVSVPNNLSARFVANPYFAGLLQRLLTDPALNFRDELTVPAQQSQYVSDYGKTAGILSPHEFSFYFRRFFPVKVGEKLTDSQLSESDPGGFVSGLTSFASALGSPVALKGLLIQYNLSLFLEYSNVYILHVQRDPVENICSLYRHRKIVAGDENEWISVKPPQFDFLKDMSPIEQVAGQVHFTNEEISLQLQSFSSERVISIAHEDFCRSPEALYNEIVRRCGSNPPFGLPSYSGPDSFDIHSYNRQSDDYLAAQSALDSIIAGNH
ncbi:sulfotransferase [Alcanivorax sp.]|uniref:sulfotransferase n=1 Tax=Alcanivorax sp. TaxID=1872427 RepID=UPI003A8E99BF